MEFISAQFFLICAEWKEVNGFDKNEIEKYQEIIESTAHLIIEFAREGGFDNASSF